MKDREAGAASAKGALSFGAQPCCPEGPSRSEAEWAPSPVGVEERRAAKRIRAVAFAVSSQATNTAKNSSRTTVHISVWFCFWIEVLRALGTGGLEVANFREARLHEAARAADAFACSKETIWEVPDFPDRRGLRKDRPCATMKPS